MSVENIEEEVARLKDGLIRFAEELEASNGRGISRSTVAKRLRAIHDDGTYTDGRGTLRNADGSRSIFDDVDQ